MVAGSDMLFLGSRTTGTLLGNIPVCALPLRVNVFDELLMRPRILFENFG
jgi:hypothetical protein